MSFETVSPEPSGHVAARSDGSGEPPSQFSHVIECATKAHVGLLSPQVYDLNCFGS